MIQKYRWTQLKSRPCMPRPPYGTTCAVHYLPLRRLCLFIHCCTLSGPSILRWWPASADWSQSLNGCPAKIPVPSTYPSGWLPPEGERKSSSLSSCPHWPAAPEGLPQWCATTYEWASGPGVGGGVDRHAHLYTKGEGWSAFGGRTRRIIIGKLSGLRLTTTLLR